MRTQVYRNFTFKSYAAEDLSTLMDRSDNFFTVESRLTAILKDQLENNEGPQEYIIFQESKDGKQRRPIEKVYTRANDDTIYIDMLMDLPETEAETTEAETTEEESK